MMELDQKVKSIPQTGRAKRDRFLARAAANTGMDQRFIAGSGPTDPTINYPRAFFLPWDEGPIGQARIASKSALTRDEYYVFRGTLSNRSHSRRLDLNFEPDARLFQKYLSSSSDFLEIVEKSSRTSQQAKVLLNKPKYENMAYGSEFIDGALILTSKVSSAVGTGLTAAGTALSFVSYGQVVGGGMIIGGEGMVPE